MAHVAASSAASAACVAPRLLTGTALSCSGQRRLITGPLAAAVMPLRRSLLEACRSSRAPGIPTPAMVGSAAAKLESQQSQHSSESDYQKLLHSLGANQSSRAVPSDAAVPTKPETQSTPSRTMGPSGSWEDVHKQAEVAAAWPSHPLVPRERLALAAAFVAQASSQLQKPEAKLGGILCDFYAQLCAEDAGPHVSMRTVSSVHCGVTAVHSEQCLEASCYEVAELLLSGHAVSIAAPKGPALEMAKGLTAGFPAPLLQAVELGPLVTLPQTVRAFRGIGFSAAELWAQRVPPPDFGGLVLQPHAQNLVIAHGMCSTAAAFGLVQTLPPDIAQCESHLSLGEEASDLAQFLPGTDRGGSQVGGLLELLWAMQGTELIGGSTSSLDSSVSIEAAHKHFILTSSGELPEDVVNAAIVAASSPLPGERATLHLVGLGGVAARGNRPQLREPLRSFLVAVQSAKGSSGGGLHWQVREHVDWSGFCDWLHTGALEETELPQLFATRRQLELEVRRRCAQVGGVAWPRLFVAEPFEQLRRWTVICERAPESV